MDGLIEINVLVKLFSKNVGCVSGLAVTNSVIIYVGMGEGWERGGSVPGDILTIRQSLTSHCWRLWIII